MFAGTFYRRPKGRWKVTRGASRQFWAHLMTHAPKRPRIVARASFFNQLWMDPYALMVNMTTLSFVMPYLASGIYMRLKHTSATETVAESYEEESSVYSSATPGKQEPSEQYSDEYTPVPFDHLRVDVDMPETAIYEQDLVNRIRKHIFGPYNSREVIQLGQDIRRNIERDDKPLTEYLSLQLRLAYKERQEANGLTERNPLRLPMTMAIHALLRQNSGKRTLEIANAFLGYRCAGCSSPGLHSRTLYHIFSTYRSKYHYVTHHAPHFEWGHFMLLQTLILLLRERNTFICGELVDQVIEWLVWLGCLEFSSRLWGACMLFSVRKHDSREIPLYLVNSANVILENIGNRLRNRTEPSKALSIFLNLQKTHGVKIRTPAFFRILREYHVPSVNYQFYYSQRHGSKRLSLDVNRSLRQIVELKLGALCKTTPQPASNIYYESKLLLRDWVASELQVSEEEIPLFENNRDNKKAWEDESLYNHPIMSEYGCQTDFDLSTSDNSAFIGDGFAAELATYASKYLANSPRLLYQLFDVLYSRNLVNINTFNIFLKQAVLSSNSKLGYVCIERAVQISRQNMSSKLRGPLTNAFLSNVLDFLKAEDRQLEMETLLRSIIAIYMERLTSSPDVNSMSQGAPPRSSLLIEHGLPEEKLDAKFLLCLIRCAVYTGKTGLCEKIWALCKYHVEKAQRDRYSDVDESDPSVDDITGLSSSGSYPPRKRQWHRPVHSNSALNPGIYVSLMRLMKLEINRSLKFSGSNDTVTRKDNTKTSSSTRGWFFHEIHNWCIPRQTLDDKISHSRSDDILEEEPENDAKQEAYVELYGFRPLHMVPRKFRRAHAARVGACAIYDHAIIEYNGIVYPSEDFFNVALDIFAPLDDDRKVHWYHDSNDLQRLSKILLDIEAYGYQVPWGFSTAYDKTQNRDPSTEWRVASPKLVDNVA